MAEVKWTTVAERKCTTKGHRPAQGSRANCSGRMSPGQPKRQTGWGIRTGSGATYASSGSWEPALSLLRLRR